LNNVRKENEENKATVEAKMQSAKGSLVDLFGHLSKVNV
jgi:hypothetical protein